MSMRIVLDIQDPRGLVEALRTAGSAWNITYPKLRALANIIEAQLPPPKPPEPQGLGAVVEDDNGMRWTRVEAGSDDFTRNPWFPNTDGYTQPREYDEIAAVRVLSEGVR